MYWRTLKPAALIVCAALMGCTTQQVDDASLGARPSFTSSAPTSVVTADIQDGIEKHIEDQIQQGGGYFRLPFEDRQLQLKLVRVHTEYLANLGARRHFACVDMASIDGNVYDVDFFLAGDPGAMIVTETTVHKVNGQPLYVWKQLPNKTWRRAAVEQAPPKLLGVITDRDAFEFQYKANLPPITDSARMWIPLPSTDAFQTVEVKSIAAPRKPQVLEDKKFGNKVLYLTLEPEDSGKTVTLRFAVQRKEKGVYPADAPADAPVDTPTLRSFLRPQRLVPANDEFSDIAAKVVEGKDGDLVRARALYDHTIDRMRYMKYGSGWGQGDAVYACDARTGNCTDFHSYFIALARASGIPARFAIGASIPSARDDGRINGYHCWAEFYTDGMWWPVDISEADKCSALSTYYFGRHPANRIELSRGRDLEVEPGPASGPINFLAYPVLEVAGRPVRVAVEFSFRRAAPAPLDGEMSSGGVREPLVEAVGG